MIAWFGPAMLLLLLSAAPQARSEAAGGAVATVIADELAGVAARPSSVRAEPRGTIALRVVAPPRVQARCRSVHEAGLPAPRAP